MITDLPPVTARPVPRASGPRSLLALARLETRRLLLHPASLLGWGLLLFNLTASLVVDNGPRHAHEVIDTLMSFYPGILLILAAHLVASRDHRAGSDELLAAAPQGSRERTAALLLTALPVAALGLLVVLIAHVGNLRLDRYWKGIEPSLGQFLQGPVTLAGAILLGVMTARWTTARMAAVLVIVGLVAVNIVLNAREDSLSYFGPMMGWARWGLAKDAWGGLFPGSPEWRVGYLVGLCVLAALGSMLPTVERPLRIVVAGLVTLALTAACAWQMLP